MFRNLVRHGLVASASAAASVLAIQGIASAGGIIFTPTPGTVELSTGSPNSTAITIDWTDSNWSSEPGEFDAFALLDEYATDCDPLPDGVTFSWQPSTGATWLNADGQPTWYWGGSTIPALGGGYQSAPTGILIGGTPLATGTYTLCFSVINGGSFDSPPVTSGYGNVPITLTVVEGLPSTGNSHMSTILLALFFGTLGATASIVSGRRRAISRP